MPMPENLLKALSTTTHEVRHYAQAVLDRLEEEMLR